MECVEKPKVALVTLGDSRKEFYESRIQIVKEEKEKAAKVLGEKFSLYMSDIIYSEKESLAVSNKIKEQGIQAVIIFLPIWGTPSLAFRIAQSTSKPVVILGNERTDSSSLVVLLAVAGMLDQCGKKCIRIAGDIEDNKVYQQISSYICACNLVEELRKSSYCMLGGKSIGIGTTVADPSQWERIFGVGFDHADQFEIFYRGENIEKERLERHLKWWKERVNIEYGGLFTEKSLEKQMRSYLALKDIVSENGYDFLGIKCQQEMSDHYALQCLSVALLNNNFDADGEKLPIQTSCECDCDGALTMRILSLVNENRPTCLVDIKYFSEENKEFILANCGSMAPYFSNPSGTGEAYPEITMMKHSFGLAGGGSTQFIASAGKATVARLFRSDGEYTLGCFEGDLFMKPIEELKKTSWCYPHQFIHADIDYNLFFKTMNSNHLHTVYGNHLETLKLFCDMVGIKFLCYNKDMERR